MILLLTSAEREVHNPPPPPPYTPGEFCWVEMAGEVPIYQGHCSPFCLLAYIFPPPPPLSLSLARLSPQTSLRYFPRNKIISWRARVTTPLKYCNYLRPPPPRLMYLIVLGNSLSRAHHTQILFTLIT